MNELRIGDRVRIKIQHDPLDNNAYTGVIAAVDFNRDLPYLVDHEGVSGHLFHRGGGILPRRTGWWYPSHSLEKINSVLIREDAPIDSIL